MIKKRNRDVKINSLLGKESECAGDFTAQGSARLDGRVNGNVTVTGTLILGSTASVSGNIIAEAVVIGGEVQGNITAPEKAELTATAKVLGDIATKVIVIDENAVFQGRVDMNQEVPAKKLAKTVKKTVRTGRKSAKAAIAEALKEVAEEQKRAESAEEANEQEAEEKKTAEE